MKTKLNKGGRHSVKIGLRGLMILVILFTQINLISQKNEARILPLDFEEKAFSHIENLVKIGPRPAGSVNEMNAATYIQNQLAKIGLNAKIEMFEYDSYEFNSIDLEINNCHCTPIGLGFTPYKNISTYNGKAVFIDSKDSFDNYTKDSIIGKTIISNDFTSHFQLLQFQPELIIYVDSIDFCKLKTSSHTEYHLNIEGAYRRQKSPNVVAQIGVSSVGKKEILIGVHTDSYRISPGASDNGSGIGVMIELAKFLKQKENQLNGVFKFISFGAEELGVLGSRRYVMNHSESLKKCALFFDIDDVGGSGTGVIELYGGVSKLPEKMQDELSVALASQPWEGTTSYWRGLPEKYILNFFTTVNHPDWLVDIIETSVKVSGYNIGYTQNFGADQMPFTCAGVVTSGIGISGKYQHTAFDNLAGINKESLLKAGELTMRILLKMNSLLK